MGRLVYVKNKKTKPYELGHWSQKKKLEVVTNYLAMGNLSETSRMCNVPITTLRDWKTQPWWKELVDSITSGEDTKMGNKMTKIVDRALEDIMTRLEEGDYQYDQKTGRLIKIPLKARDLERITSGLLDKRELLRKAPMMQQAEQISQAERLVNLAKDFAKLSGRIVEEKVVDEYIEGEYDALHDEREARLQEGTSLGEEEETSPSEEQSTT